MEQEMTKRSVLDERPIQIPVAGKIHTGIKVLNSKHAGNPAAKAIYHDGVANGWTYAMIDKKIGEALKLEVTALVPRNTPYFRVSRADFTYPEMADLIFGLYAEDRGDGKQLYRFPVVFAFDDWLQNMPHQLGVFTARGRKFWSVYDSVGKRFCMTFPSVTVDPKNQRATRAWGGRTPQLRQENEGRCDPEICPEYQRRECKLHGRVLFYIPGVPGSSLIELGTTSIYSLKQNSSQMQLVSGLRMGRLSGVQGGKAIFRLTKIQADVSMITDKGEAERKKQFLVNLEADLDMTSLMIGQEERMLAHQAGAAQQALAAPRTIATSDGVIEHGEPEGPEPPVEGEAGKDAVRRLRSEIADILKKRGTDAESFGLEMAFIHGANWSRDAAKLRDVKFNLESAV